MKTVKKQRKKEIIMNESRKEGRKGGKGERREGGRKGGREGKGKGGREEGREEKGKDRADSPAPPWKVGVSVL